MSHPMDDSIAAARKQQLTQMQSRVEKQHQLMEVKNKLADALVALEETQFHGLYADRFLSVAEQYMNLAILALTEGRERMREES